MEILGFAFQSGLLLKKGTLVETFKNAELNLSLVLIN